MIQEDLQNLKTLIENEGIFVAVQPDHSLFVGCDANTFGGLQVFQQNLVLYYGKSAWRCVFPSEGMAVYDVSGQFDELAMLMLRVIREAKNAKTTWSQAFQKVVPEHRVYIHLPS